MLPTDPPFESPVKTLETARLSIRVDSEASYIEAFHTLDDEALKATFGLMTDEALAKQKEKVFGGMSTYRTSVVFFHLYVRELQKVVGGLAFHNWYPVHSRAEIGYAMSDEPYKRQGYMSEAIRPVIAFGFEAMNLLRIEAFIDPQNAPSVKLAERVGFRKEGLLKSHVCYDGVHTDSAVYGLLRSEFDAAANT